MNVEVDWKIMEIIKQNPDSSISQIAEALGIAEDEVEKKIKILTDTREKILLVDDELETLLPLKRALEAENYRVIEAPNGLSAIEMTRLERPDIILLDLMMPGMDGIEVCRLLKQDTSTGHIPIIMLTALGKVENKIEGIEIGADDYVTKPFDLGELKARIKMILRRTRI